jgi:exopolysaccharide biosynthesis polyprenyl glycosylphosphotransferase
MTREMRFQTSILFGGDMTALLLSWGAAYWLRFHSGWIRLPMGKEGLVVHPADIYFAPVLFSCILFSWVWRKNVYPVSLSGKWNQEVQALFYSFLTSGPILIAGTYFIYRDRYSRLVLVLFFCFAFLSLLFFHGAARWMRFHGWLKSVSRRRVLIFGAGGQSKQLADAYLALHPGTDLLDIVQLEEAAQFPLEQAKPDEALILCPQLQYPALKALLERLESDLVDIKFIPDWGDFHFLGYDVEHAGTFPLIHLRRSPIHGWNLILKRAMDLILCLLAFLVLSPLFLLIALLIVLDSGFPIFFRQQRMSLDGRVFTMFKFRSMVPDAEKRAVTAWTQTQDSRRTRIGVWLRSLSLDELPQLYNILRGDMSFVGPRPEMAHLIDEFRRHIPHYYLRYKIKSGLTGWAQIHGLRGNTSLEERVRYDLYYIEHFSLWLDVRILFLTLFRAWRNAY